MTNQSRHIPLWRTKQATALDHAREYQAMIDTASPGESKHRLGYWKSQAVRWRRTAEAMIL